MEKSPEKLWFRAKTYGYGWTPCSIEGWVVIFLYLTSVATFFVAIDQNSHSGSDTLFGFILPLVSLTFLLIVVCVFKGEKPRWRWGKEKGL